MVDLINSVTQSVISAFLEASLKAIAEKVSKGRKLTAVEALTLLVTERFDSVQAETRGLRDGQAALRDRLDSLAGRLDVAGELAQLKAKVAQLEARL